MKHKYCEVIKAWAEGAEIQSRQSLRAGSWCDNHTPQWVEECEYRVKPTQHIEVVEVLHNGIKILQHFVMREDTIVITRK